MSRRLRWAGLAAALVAWPMGPSAAQGPGDLFEMRDVPRPLPELSFVDAEGHDLSLADFAGKVVVLNVWATWCAPCRQELPTLAHLQDELGGPSFQVIALSTDPPGDGAVPGLYRELDLSEAGIFVDATGSAMRDLGIYALPTTLLIDAEGRELGRLTGAATWDGDEALAAIGAAIAEAPGGSKARSP